MDQDLDLPCAAALEALRDAVHHRLRGTRQVVALRSGGRVVATAEVPSQFAVWRLSDRLRPLGFMEGPSDETCPDCDSVFDGPAN